MVQLVPGDPGRRILGRQADPAAVELVHQQLGLDRPLLTQFADYTKGIVRGDLGTSYVTRRPVTQEIADRIGSTLQICVLALAIIFVFGVGLGMLAGAVLRPRGRVLHAMWSGATGVLSVLPAFVTGTVLAFVFAVSLRWFSLSATGSWSAAVLPAVAISLAPIAVTARLARTETVEALESEYVRAARCKRLPWWKLYVHHVLPNVVTASLTLAGMIFAGLVTGAIVIESVFARPGVGSLLVQAVIAGDFPVIQAITLIGGSAVVLANSAVDLVLGRLDPQRLEKRR
jgi:peptide/nickel transport system permease protein